MLLIKFRCLCVGLLLLLSAAGIAQKNNTNYSRQLSFSHENDLFAFRGTDGYYTSGIFVNYSVARQKNKAGVVKTIDNFEISQRIYTAGIREVFVITQLDRPVTGYLYGQFSRTQFKNNNRFLQFAGSIGTVGPMALGKELLGVIHPLLQINAKSWEWIFDYGLKNEIGVNVHGSYGFSMIPQQNAGLIQITPVTSATLGTSFTNISQSVLLQIGRHNAMHESTYWNTNLQATGSTTGKYKNEFFAYYQPELMYQLYNATVQGGLFRSDKGRIVSTNKPLVMTNKIGAMFATPKYSLNVHLTYQSKEARSQEKSHIFGGGQLVYRF